MRTRTKRPWILVMLFAGMCIAAIAEDCAAGDAAGDAAVWVSQLSSRLSGHVDGELGGVTFELHVALCAPVSVGMSFDASATR